MLSCVKFILMRSPRLGAADQLKLDRQLFTTLTERTPYWLTIVSIGLIGVAIAGKFEAVGWPNGWLDGIFTSKNVWIAFVLLSALPYIPLMQAARRLPIDVPRNKLLTLHVMWAVWLLVLSVAWLSAALWFLQSQPWPQNDFSLGRRTFLYLTIVSQVFAILLLSSSRLVLFAILIGITTLFAAGLAFDRFGHIPTVILIVFYFSPLTMYFLMAWVIPIDQRKIRVRSILLASARVRADAERKRANHFIASMSHDLRQPLSTLALQLNSLLTRTSTPAIIADLQALKTQIDAIASMINSAFDLSRLEAGTWRVRVREVSLQHSIETVVAELRPEAIAKGVQFEASSLPYIVRTDADALERILRNLIGNALRYTPAKTAGGEPGAVSLTCAVDGAHMRISVKDNGIGIPSEKIVTIFEEYVQLNNPERSRIKGLGLGLSIVRGLSQKLGHGLSVESVERKGSCFSIIVPLVGLVRQSYARMLMAAVADLT